MPDFEIKAVFSQEQDYNPVSKQKVTFNLGVPSSSVSCSTGVCQEYMAKKSFYEILKLKDFFRVTTEATLNVRVGPGLNVPANKNFILHYQATLYVVVSDLSGRVIVRAIKTLDSYEGASVKDGKCYQNDGFWYSDEGINEFVNYDFYADSPLYQLSVDVYAVDQDGTRFYITMNPIEFCNITGENKYSTDMTVHLSLTVTLTGVIRCSGASLESALCKVFCQCTDKNCDTCYEAYSEYCFGDDENKARNFGDLCKDYYGKYFEIYGPKAELDENIKEYCQRKYNGQYSKTFENPNSFDAKFCACHLPDSYYENFANSVKEKYIIEESMFGYKDVCLFPICPVSPFPSINSVKCRGVGSCLNVLKFSNDGYVHGTDITINQKNNCKIKKRGEEVTFVGEIKTEENNEILFVIVFLLISFLIFAAIFLFIYFRKRRGWSM